MYCYLRCMYLIDASYQNKIEFLIDQINVYILLCLWCLTFLFLLITPRSSGASARLSIANSPYEYDITGNLPNPVSRRSSGESSTNIGSVSALMQKANLGSQSNLVVVHPPPSGPVPPSGCPNSTSGGTRLEGSSGPAGPPGTNNTSC